jgi:hypothetical protein
VNRTLPVVLLFAAAPAFACQPALTGAGVHTAQGKDFAVAWRPQPVTLQVSEFFTVEVATCANAGAAPPAQLRVDAVMPEHKHGMNYRPTVEALGSGRFLAEGFML